MSIQSNTILGSEILMRAKVQTTTGVPEVFTNSDLFLPASDVTESPNAPVTVNPIIASPSERPAISFQTDNIGNLDAKTFMFSGENLINKVMASRVSIAYFTKATTALTIVAAETFIVDGITATAVASETTTVEIFISEFQAYVENGTAGTHFSFSGALSGNWLLFFDYPASNLDGLIFVAVNPLSTATPPTASGTGSTWLTRTASTGTGTQLNLPELYPYFVAAGLSPTFDYSLYIDDTREGNIYSVYTFVDDMSTYRAAISSDLTSVSESIKKLQALNLGTGTTSVTDLKTDIDSLILRVSRQYNGLSQLGSKLSAAIDEFKADIKAGKYSEALSGLKARLGELNGKGYIRIRSDLLDQQSITVLGWTLKNVSGGTKTAAQVAAKLATIAAAGTADGFEATGSTTATYSKQARLNTAEVEITKSGDQSIWTVALTSTQAGFSASIIYPLETVFELTATRSSVQTLVDALSNSNDAADAAFAKLKSDLSISWSKASQNLASQDFSWTTAKATGWHADIATYSADAAWDVSKLTYSYDAMTLNDAGILDLQRLTVEYLRLNEQGDRKKLSTLYDVLVSSFDLSIPANQPPEIALKLAGEPAGVSYADASVITFSASRLKLMPEAKKGTVTFQSLVLDEDVYIDGNCLVQEFQLPNFAGVMATRVNTTASNFHKISAERTNRKASITVIDADLTSVVGGISNYNELMNKKFKFKMSVGTSPGYRYTLEVKGLLTGEQATNIQNSVGARQLELTVSSASLRIS